MSDNKPALTISDQLALLRRRGMQIEDETAATEFLGNVSYYRLKGYWWNDQDDRVNHHFREGTSFQKVERRYNFDRELRLLFINMIERIEVGIRTRLTYQFSHHYGPHWFADVNNFHNRKQWSQLMQTIRRDVDRSSEPFIKAHLRKYGSTDSRLPPAWKTLEILTLGVISKLYATLRKDLNPKTQIARNLGLGKHELLENWLQLITILRNVCAHHSRVYDRPLSLQLRLPRRPRRPWVNDRQLQRDSAYAVLCACQYLLHSISPGNRFRQRLEQLLVDYPTVDITRLGMPTDWRTAPLWR